MNSLVTHIQQHSTAALTSPIWLRLRAVACVNYAHLCVQSDTTIAMDVQQEDGSSG